MQRAAARLSSATSAATSCRRGWRKSASDDQISPISWCRPRRRDAYSTRRAALTRPLQAANDCCSRAVLLCHSLRCSRNDSQIGGGRSHLVGDLEPVALIAARWRQPEPSPLLERHVHEQVLCRRCRASEAWRQSPDRDCSLCWQVGSRTVGVAALPLCCCDHSQLRWQRMRLAKAAVQAL